MMIVSMPNINVLFIGVDFFISATEATGTAGEENPPTSKMQPNNANGNEIVFVSVCKRKLMSFFDQFELIDTFNAVSPSEK